MEKAHSSKAASNLEMIEALVQQGKTVVSSEDSAVVRSAIKSIKEGRTETLYLKPTVFEAIRRWYWTPDRAKLVGFKPITPEVSERVKEDFKISCRWICQQLGLSSLRSCL